MRFQRREASDIEFIKHLCRTPWTCVSLDWCWCEHVARHVFCILLQRCQRWIHKSIYVLVHWSVLFFICPRSEGWPRHGRTFSIYLCPLSFCCCSKGVERPAKRCYVGLVAVGVQEQAEDILTCSAAATKLFDVNDISFPYSHALPSRTVVLAIVFTV